jgi:hypothetical protein
MDHNIYIYKKQSKKILGLISQIYYSDHKIGITWLIEKKNHEIHFSRKNNIKWWNKKKYKRK